MNLVLGISTIHSLCSHAQSVHHFVGSNTKWNRTLNIDGTSTCMNLWFYLTMAAVRGVCTVFLPWAAQFNQSKVVTNVFFVRRSKSSVCLEPDIFNFLVVSSTLLVITVVSFLHNFVRIVAAPFPVTSQTLSARFMPLYLLKPYLHFSMRLSANSPWTDRQSPVPL